jgi:hypothetical protein
MKKRKYGSATKTRAAAKSLRIFYFDFGISYDKILTLSQLICKYK